MQVHETDEFIRFFNVVSSVSGCLSLLISAVPCAKGSLKGKWISLGFLEALITSDYQDPKLWGKGVTCSDCPAPFILAIQLHCLCTSHFHCVHLLGKVLKVTMTFTLTTFQWKICLCSVFKQALMKIEDVCHCQQEQGSRILSRIFGILESLDQHILKKFFVRKMRDVAGICFLCCVFCSTEKMRYKGGMLHFPIRGFQSLSVLEMSLMACFSKLALHILLGFNRSLHSFSFKSSDVRGGRKHTRFTFDLKNTLFNGAFPVKEKNLSKTNGIVLFQEHMK